jgi:hydrocephalus-inducing protein
MNIYIDTYICIFVYFSIGKFPVVLTFRPQEEVVYNFNVQCDIKRKPNKLSINIKGEGYAVHPILQLEAEGDEGDPANRFITLLSAPATNYVDFGAVQVYDTVMKKLSVTNSGKYNFDYLWEIDQMGAMLSLSGGKMGGTLQKGGFMEYQITFSPQKEVSLGGSGLSFTVAGKYTYNLSPMGMGVQPALRFSFMQHDFGPCYVTSPGGSTVVEEAVLRITNHDLSSNISIECTYQKTRALWVDCPPTMVAPGAVLEVPVCFAPREVKDYAFAVPFMVNGQGKLIVSIVGKGAMPQLEMANPGQRKIAFGVANVGSENRRSVPLVNRSKKAITVQLIDEGQHGSGALSDRCVGIYPTNEVTVQPRESLNVQVVFSPNKRVGTFNEDLFIKYAGLTRKLLVVSGKAQGSEVWFILMMIVDCLLGMI